MQKQQLGTEGGTENLTGKVVTSFTKGSCVLKVIEIRPSYYKFDYENEELSYDYGAYSLELSNGLTNYSVGNLPGYGFLKLAKHGIKDRLLSLLDTFSRLDVQKHLTFCKALGFDFTEIARDNNPSGHVFLNIPILPTFCPFSMKYKDSLLESLSFATWLVHRSLVTENKIKEAEADAFNPMESESLALLDIVEEDGKLKYVCSSRAGNIEINMSLDALVDALNKEGVDGEKGLSDFLMHYIEKVSKDASKEKPFNFGRDFGAKASLIKDFEKVFHLAEQLGKEGYNPRAAVHKADLSINSMNFIYAVLDANEKFMKLVEKVDDLKIVEPLFLGEGSKYSPFVEILDIKEEEERLRGEALETLQMVMDSDSPTLSFGN